MDGFSADKSKLYGGLYLLLAVIVLSAIIPSSWFKGSDKKNTIFSRVETGDKKLITRARVIQDTNKDGTISWSEAVSSSLSDSTSTIALIKDTPIDQKKIAQLNDPNNLTADFTKNLFLATTQLRDRGITDETTKKKTISYLMQQEAEKIVQYRYALKDLHIESTESKTSIKLYGNTVAPLVKGILSKDVIVSDLTNLALYTQSQKQSDLSPIIKNKERVDALLQKLLLVKVPPSAAPYHLLVVNRVAYYKDTLESFGNMESDPVRATLMFNSYETTLLLLAKIPSRLNEYFNAQNIVFGTSEAGYIFTSGYSI